MKWKDDVFVGLRARVESRGDRLGGGGEGRKKMRRGGGRRRRVREVSRGGVTSTASKEMAGSPRHREVRPGSTTESDGKQSTISS